MSFQENIQKFSGQPLHRQLLLSLLKDYLRPNDKINELVKKQMLIPVKRGIFIPGPASNSIPPEPFLLANHLLGPSYVSLESALSHWGMIPEQVFEISSVTISRSASYDTRVGRYTYQHMPLSWFSYGQQQVELAKDQVALVASVEKALCDKIISTSGLLFRSSVQLQQWLIEDMRMEKTMLSGLDTEIIRSWTLHAPKKESLQLLIKTLEKL